LYAKLNKSSVCAEPHGFSRVRKSEEMPVSRNGKTFFDRKEGPRISPATGRGWGILRGNMMAITVKGSGGGGGTSHEDVTALKQHVLVGYTALTNDCLDDEPAEGTMQKYAGQITIE